MIEYFGFSIIITTFLTYFFSALWYSAFFGKKWRPATGVSKTEFEKILKEKGITESLIVEFICRLVRSYGYFILF